MNWQVLIWQYVAEAVIARSVFTIDDIEVARGDEI